MKKTEKIHWINGHQVRGNWFHTLNMSLYNIGLMITWGHYGFNKKPYISVDLFKLI